MANRELFADRRFIESLRRRDNDAIERLVREYTRHLTNAALGMGFDPNAAGELAQDVWITFFEKAPSFEGRSHVRTFLFGILYNKALEKRRERRFSELDDNIEAVMDARFDPRGRWLSPPMDPERFAMGMETGRMIEKCLDGLPPQQRTAFVLKEVEDGSTEEICNILEVSATNLGVLLFRARNRLRECLEKQMEGPK
ncbi:MAG: sigma-70 family RNA polymerase sigma factor [Nitrospinae bacterium]|nr:sigma-70 family RNA polymerase sigma factor [Nitrospinota bacterium]